MFCPRCSTNNLDDQKFCRQCGLALTNVHRILNGQLDELVDKLKKSADLLSGGLVTLSIFAVIAIITVFIGSGRSVSAAINLIIGLVITLPMLIKGLNNFSCVEKIFKEKEKNDTKELKPQVQQLSTAPTTAPSLSPPPEPVSITEHTTHELSPVTPTPPRQMRRE